MNTFTKVASSLVVLAILGGFSMSFGAESSTDSSAKVQTIKGFESPESVLVGSEFIFVSNIGKDPAPAQKDNDGFISKLNKQGKILERKFISNLNAPKGMIEVDNALYVVDIDRILGFDTRGKKLLEVAISGSAFLNDIVALDSNTLLLSDTGNGIIYAFNLANATYSEFMRLDLAKTGGGNGMILSADKKWLFVACYHPDGTSGGQILAIDVKSKNISVLESTKGAYDGIVFAKNGDLLVSDWGQNLQGKIYKLHAKNGSFYNGDFKGAITKQSLNLPLMQGPADMAVDSSKLYIPKMLENEVAITNLP